MLYPPVFTLYRNGSSILAQVTEVEAWDYIHRTHGFSVAHALAHEGYELRPVPPLGLAPRSVIEWVPGSFWVVADTGAQRGGSTSYTPLYEARGRADAEAVLAWLNEGLPCASA